MTEEELNKTKFRCVCSIALADEHMITYTSEDGRLGFCDHTPKNKNGDFRKGYRHWRIDNKVYKTKEESLEALKDFSQKVIPIR